MKNWIIVCMLIAFSNNLESADMGRSLCDRERSIVTIASYTAAGDLVRLEGALVGGLEAGLSVSEIREVLVHLYAYCGFPRSLNALNTFISVLKSRASAGIIDIEGRDASAYPPDKTLLELGTEIQSELVGGRYTNETMEFAPVIDRYLKEHLFGDIFGRDNLGWRSRELATIAALSVLGVEAQLRSHLRVGLNVGLTASELEDLATVLLTKVGWSEGNLVRINLPQRDTVQRTNVERVYFPNRVLIMLAGDLYLPADYDVSKKYAAIIVGHTFTGVKEQTAGLHARRLSELGYMALAFDASFWGESGGTPRNIEVPELRVEDFSAAVDYLSNHASVDGERIGVLGICGGGCYAVSAASIDHRIRAIATVSMYDLGRARRQGLGDVITYDQRMKILDEIGDQRTLEFAGGLRRDNLGVPSKLSADDTENTREFFDYYRTSRGSHPNTTTAYSFTSVAPMMNFFPFSQIATISPRPLLFIVGERAVSAYFSEDAYQKAAQPKELFVVPGASHVDLYDRDAYLNISLPKLDSFFKQYLQ